MRLPFIAALMGLLTTSLAHNIQMGAHQRECFHEVLHKDDKMTVTFQVGDREFGGAGNLEIDFWVSALVLRALCPHEPSQRHVQSVRSSVRSMLGHCDKSTCSLPSTLQVIMLTCLFVLNRSLARRTNI